MKMIATQVDDSPELLAQRVAAQQARPGFAMDPYFYRSPLVYQRELDTILYRGWLYAGHVSQVPEPGDYFLYELGEDSIIVTRDETGSIRALMNICRHRGARVCEAKQGNRKTFVCPYHGWVYNLDGSLRAARAMENLQDFDPGEYGLKAVRSCVFEGLVFINCDAGAADFQPALDKVHAALAPYQLAQARVAHRQVYSVDANWKLTVENYLECYHCGTAHRAYAKMHTLQDIGDRVSHVNDAMRARSARDTGAAGVALEVNQAFTASEHFGTDVYHSRYALYDGFLTGSEDGQPVAPLMGTLTGYDGGAGDIQLGPLCFMLAYPDHCVLYRFTPRGITETDMELVWFVNGSAKEGRDYEREALTWLWHRTTLEDEYIISRNAAGVNSRFFEPGPYQPDYEFLCIDFVKWYLQALSRQTR
ncbi:MAG: aromatic ring-hydroxylating dioxygenase subunit alpha [Halieaceae bacterium]|jgi:Rieske 2Fe-2S family protein|nr:aromatic ring-hydroxylating dioxygenase subunit alpha [Halieaceae bacterium]